MPHPIDQVALPAPARTWRIAIALTRLVSLGLALVATLIVVLWPDLLAGSHRLLAQAVMPVMLLGIAGAVVHGLDLVPRKGLLATMSGPWVAWPLIASSLAFLFLQNDL